jgi:hypothetical protein
MAGPAAAKPAVIIDVELAAVGVPLTAAAVTVIAIDEVAVAARTPLVTTKLSTVIAPTAGVGTVIRTAALFTGTFNVEVPEPVVVAAGAVSVPPVATTTVGFVEIANSNVTKLLGPATPKAVVPEFAPVLSNFTVSALVANAGATDRTPAPNAATATSAIRL